MEELLTLFVDEFNRKEHLSFLLFNKSLTVFFDGRYKKYGLNIDSHQISWFKRASNDHEAIILSGTEEVFSALLSGEIPLRKAEKKGLLQVYTTFRTKLLLEAIFLLTLAKGKGEFQSVGA